MTTEDLIVPVYIALVLGFVLGYFYVSARITAIEDRSRAEAGKLETGSCRRDTQGLRGPARSTLKGG